MFFHAHSAGWLHTVPCSAQTLGWLSVEDNSQLPKATLNTSPVVPPSSETAVVSRGLVKLQVSLALPPVRGSCLLLRDYLVLCMVLI